MRDASILATLFLRRGRIINRILGLTTGAVVAIALIGLFGLTSFLGLVSHVGDSRGFGAPRAEGCIQGSYRYDPIDLQQYENILLSATCPSPQTPAGLAKFPTPGQVYLSPALDDLRKSDPRIAARYPTTSGIISPAGLTGSNELRAIIGVAPRPPGAVGVVTFDTFGSAGGDYLATYLRFNRQTLFVLGLFFTVPSAALLIVASTRLNARVRARQLGLLSIVGIPTPVLRSALMFESAALVGCGAVGGLVIASLTFARAQPTFVAWAPFAGDFAAPWWAYLITLILVLVTAVAAAWFGADTTLGRASRTLVASTPRRQLWRWVLLVVGLTLGAASTWRSMPLTVVLAGRLVTVAGLFAVAAPICAATGRRLSASSNALVSVAGTRLARPSGALTRSLAALISGLFVLSIGATTIQSRSESPAALQHAQTADGMAVVEVRRATASVQNALSSYQLLSGRSSTDGTYIGTMSGPCEVVAQIIGNRSFTCPKSMYGVTVPEQRAPAGVTAAPTVLNGPRAEFLTGYVVNTTARSAIKPNDNLILIPLPTAAADSLYDRLVAQDASTNVRIDGSAFVSGASELIGILDVFRWGALFAVTISLISTLISLVSLMNDRQPGNNYLQILGLTPRQAAALTVVEVAAAAAGCTAMALSASWIWALANESPEQPVALLSTAAPFILALISLVAAASAVVWYSLRASGVTVVPDRDNLASALDTFSPTMSSRPTGGPRRGTAATTQDFRSNPA
jgi:hypothetical protein